MSGSAYCRVCEIDLDLEFDVEERQKPQQPEPSYHCSYCGSSDIDVKSID